MHVDDRREKLFCLCQQVLTCGINPLGLFLFHTEVVQPHWHSRF